jgi:hypothetical protein
VRPEVSDYNADKDSNIPDSRAATVVEDGTNCSKTTNVTLYYSVCVFFVGDDVKGARSLEDLFDHC